MATGQLRTFLKSDHVSQLILYPLVHLFQLHIQPSTGGATWLIYFALFNGQSLVITRGIFAVDNGTKMEYIQCPLIPF